jgi:hypothetical protein
LEFKVRDRRPVWVKGEKVKDENLKPQDITYSPNRHLYLDLLTKDYYFKNQWRKLCVRQMHT